MKCQDYRRVLLSGSGEAQAMRNHRMECVHCSGMHEEHMAFEAEMRGANRMYESRRLRFAAWNGGDFATDSEGRSWKVSEAALTGPGGQKLKRLPAHRAFWFGWYSAYPDTRLVK